MRLLFSLLFLLSFTLLQANNNAIEYPTLPSKAEKIEDFIPSGWKLLTEARGDLNNDSRNDVVFVIESIEKLNSDFEDGNSYNVRIVGIALWNFRDGVFELVVQSNDFIPTTEGNPAITEDPLESILIKNGTARFYFHYIDNGQLYITDQTFVFYYNKNQFELGGYVRSKLHRSTQAYTRESLNYSAGKGTLLKRNNDSEIGATSDVNFTPDKKYNLATIGKARLFKPQEIKYSEFAGTY